MHIKPEASSHRTGTGRGLARRLAWPALAITSNFFCSANHTGVMWHFPMSEDPEGFLSHLRPVLAGIEQEP